MEQKKQTIQGKVLRFIYFNKETNVEAISKRTGLRRSQIYCALSHLKHRGTITIKKTKQKPGYCCPPILNLIISPYMKNQAKIEWILENEIKKEKTK